MKISDVMDAIGKGVCDAIDYVADKNRTNAQLSRLKTVIRHETDTLSKSYIALGKYYYENLRGSAEGENERICDSIENSIKNINAAREKYEKIAGKIKEEKSKSVASDISAEATDTVETTATDTECDLCACEEKTEDLSDTSEFALEPESESSACEISVSDENEHSSDGVQKTRKTIKMILKKSEEQTALVDDVNTDGEAAE